MSKVELILPVFQEVAQVPHVVPAVAAWLSTRPDTCARFVDDGSRDGTADAIAQEIAAVPGVAIRLDRSPLNRGKGATVREAMLSSRADIVCFTDGDLAYSLDQVDLLVTALSDGTADVAIGSRELAPPGAPRPGWRRRGSGALFNLAVRTMLGLPYADTQAGLKGFRADAARRLFGRSRIDGFAFDAELLYLARLERLRVVEVPARVADDHASLGSTVNLLIDPWRMLWTLLRIRRLHRSASSPHPAPAS